MRRENFALLNRRKFLSSLAATAGANLVFPSRLLAAQKAESSTFIFTNDIHACRMANGLAPNCAEEGKTDANLLRHVRAINKVPHLFWPKEISGQPTNLVSAGKRIGGPRGVVTGGDLTDDGGGQRALPGEGYQLRQFSQRYEHGVGPDRVHFPVYLGLGNHDLDQDGPAPHVDWYRRELRDYVEMNHRSTVFFKPPVPVTNYDVESDCYSWDWPNVHLVQTQRFAGDTSKGAVSGLDWLIADLATYAANRKPVILFQHYGWDPFSTEMWDADKRTFDPEGKGPPHWWSAEDRAKMVEILRPYNVIGVFHGHQHETAMIYNRDGIDIFKPKAAFMGGFAVVNVMADALDVVLCEASHEDGSVVFTESFSKKI
jgi:cytolysin (calcineurin-like family phosphatase)